MIADHINRFVSDVDAISSFYTDALGFSLLDRGIKQDGNNYAILNSEGFEMFISEKNGFEFDDNINFRHIGFRVDNADALLSSLKAKGYAPLETQLIVKAFSKQFFLKTLTDLIWISSNGRTRIGFTAILKAKTRLPS